LERASSFLVYSDGLCQLLYSKPFMALAVLLLDKINQISVWAVAVIVNIPYPRS
jgi:hypothetical protein